MERKHLALKINNKHLKYVGDILDAIEAILRNVGMIMLSNMKPVTTSQTA